MWWAWVCKCCFQIVLQKSIWARRIHEQKGKKNLLWLCPSSLVPLLLIICRMTLNPCACHVKKGTFKYFRKSEILTCCTHFTLFDSVHNVVKKFNTYYIIFYYYYCDIFLKQTNWHLNQINFRRQYSLLKN